MKDGIIMTKLFSTLLLSTALCSFLTFADTHADEEKEPEGRVNIEWQDPKSYTDIRPSNQSKKRFQESTFKKLEKFMEKLATKLPEGQHLNLVVTDLDLAGHVWPGHMAGMSNTQDVRVIKRVDFPRINFSYTLLDSNGETVKAGEETLKDMSFQEHHLGRFKSDGLRYEKNMLERWFKKTLVAKAE